MAPRHPSPRREFRNIREAWAFAMYYRHEARMRRIQVQHDEIQARIRQGIEEIRRAEEMQARNDEAIREMQEKIRRQEAEIAEGEIAEEAEGEEEGEEGQEGEKGQKEGEEKIVSRDEYSYSEEEDLPRSRRYRKDG